MNYTALRNASVTSRLARDTQRKRSKFCVHDTRVIAHLSIFLRCAVSVCPQPPILSQYSDATIAVRYTAKLLATKSLCITMGFCNDKCYISELSGVPQRVGERL